MAETVDADEAERLLLTLLTADSVDAAETANDRAADLTADTDPADVMPGFLPTLTARTNVLDDVTATSFPVATPRVTVDPAEIVTA